MSALAGPGDLAGSLGEMAEEQRHLLGVCMLVFWLQLYWLEGSVTAQH